MDSKELSAIKACQAGDLGRFDDLYVAYAEKIYRFVYYKIFHKETAEDLTTDIFMKAMERINQFDEAKGSFSCWLYRIARNAVIDHVRTRKETVDLENAFGISSASHPDQDADTRMSFDRVMGALSSLKDDQYDIVIMRLWDGLSHQEISEILGMTESNAKQIFSRTVRHLRSEYGQTILIALICLTDGLFS